MTGKELKAFAARVPDEAVIETPERYGTGWEPLDAKNIRALFIVQPEVAFHNVCNLEDVRP